MSGLSVRRLGKAQEAPRPPLVPSRSRSCSALWATLLLTTLTWTGACGGSSSTDSSIGESGGKLAETVGSRPSSGTADLPSLSSVRGPDAGPLTRTGWTPVSLRFADPDAVPPGPKVMQSHELSPAGEGWRLDAPGSRLVRTGSGPALELGAGRADQALVAELPGDFDLQTLDRVVVQGRFRGNGSLVASLLRKGKVLLISRPLVLPTGLQITKFALDMQGPDTSPLAPGALPADTLRLECSGGFRRLVLTSVQLQRVPPSSVLPHPGEGSHWVTVGESSRPALGLHEGLPLMGEVDVPAQGLLDLSLAAVDVAGGVRLIISDGMRQERRGLSVPSSGHGWTEITVPLTSWAGRRVTLELQWDRETAAIVGPLSVGSVAEVPPVLVLITAGSYRGDHLGLAFRGVDIDTPHLDELAGRGVLFTDAQTVTNAPRSALASLLCGRTPRDTGLLDESAQLSASATTLAERLSAVGWRCEAVLATRPLRPQCSGLGQGFAHLEAPLDAWRWDAAEVVARARKRVSAGEQRPLFLWLHLADGQWPHEPDPADLARYYRPTDDPRHEGYRRPKVFKRTMPLLYRDVRDLNWTRARYKASLTAIDSALGALLEEPRVARGTVVFVGSQGLSLGEHSIWFKHVSLYPGVLHVPLIIASGDGSWPSGLRCDAPVSTLGLAATLAMGVGASAEGWQGDDLRAVVRGTVQPGPRFAVEDHAQSASVTSRGLHLIVSLQARQRGHLVERRKRAELELYDLTNDWSGEVPLPIEEGTPEGKRLGLLLLRWLGEAEDLGWAEAGVLDDAALEHLEQLGYVGPLPRTPEHPWSIDH